MSKVGGLKWTILYLPDTKYYYCKGWGYGLNPMRGLYLYFLGSWNFICWCAVIIAHCGKKVKTPVNGKELLTHMSGICNKCAIIYVWWRWKFLSCVPLKGVVTGLKANLRSWLSAYFSGYIHSIAIFVRLADVVQSYTVLACWKRILIFSRVISIPESFRLSTQE